MPSILLSHYYWCLERHHFQCLLQWGIDDNLCVKSGDGRGCMPVRAVLSNGLLILSLKWLHSIYRHRRGQHGCRRVAEDTEVQEAKPLCRKLVYNQLLRPVHQRALRPTIYKHLLQPKLKICYSSRGWMCYKYADWPQVSSSTLFFSLIQFKSECLCALHVVNSLCTHKIPSVTEVILISPV